MAKKSKAQQLRERLRRYVNHRAYIIDHYKEMKGQSELDSIDRLKVLLNTIAHSTAATTARAILRYEGDLRNILPGSKSKYHEGDLERVNGLLRDCEEIAATGGQVAA